MVRIRFKDDYCKGCGLCVEACPKKLLRISEERLNDKGHRVAEIGRPEACTGCTSCALMCPDCVIHIEKE